MNRLLIVGRVTPGDENRIAEIFAEADATDLPTVTGVRHRSLYQIGDLYLHLMETDGGPSAMERGREHPAFRRVIQQLAECTSPYPETWRSHRDAMATCFYRWDAPQPARR